MGLGHDPMSLVHVPYGTAGNSGTEAQAARCSKPSAAGYFLQSSGCELGEAQPITEISFTAQVSHSWRHSRVGPHVVLDPQFLRLILAEPPQPEPVAKGSSQVTATLPSQ